MKPILTVVHIYYPELWPELKKCLTNITAPYDLYVTTVEKNAYLKDDVVKFKNDAHFEIVENRGFDVGPFIHILKQVDLDKYSYLIKLHTKRDMPKNTLHFRGMHSNIWRNNLLFPFQDRETFRKYIENFKNYPFVGMQGYYKLFVKNNADKIHDKDTYNNCESFLREKKLPKICFQYLAGTMFIVRANLFKYIQNLEFTLQDFSPSNRADTGDLAHIFERLFGYAVYVQGYTVRDTLVPKEREIAFQKKDISFQIFFKIKRFFYQKKHTLSGYTIIKICKIPVYRRKV